MRYDRQILVPTFNVAGHLRLRAATIAILGCGGLGCALAEWLTRMGAGTLRVADSDHVTLDNIHRQVLFTEQDALQGKLKVEAAAAHLKELNSEVEIVLFAHEITSRNIAEFAGDAQLVLDATDHVPTRYLLNDYCVSRSLPWIYTGVSGNSGLILPVVPGKTPCLRCVFPEMPQAAELSDCASHGVLPPAVTMAASLQTAMALRMITGAFEEARLLRFDIWEPSLRASRIEQHPECPCCAQRRFMFLSARE